MDNQVLTDETQASPPTAVIELPSITITRTANGYECRMRYDQIPHHLANCQDLWDATDHILHHFRLTPQLLTEIYSFRKKCAELKWDDEAIARYYAEVAAAKKAESPASAKG